MIDEKTIEALVREVLSQLSKDAPAVEAAASPARQTGDGVLPDITSAAMRVPLLSHPQDPDGLARMITKTPARIGIGRAGGRLKTLPMLTLRADHAAARDTVMADVAPAVLEACGLFAVETRCSSRDEHLTRPDLGRQFSAETLEEIKSRCTAKPQVQIIVSDGLSSKAVEANAADILPALTDGLKRHGFQVGTPFFVRYGRVPSMDAVTEALGSEVTCMLIGERPGLVTAKSMSAYITYKGEMGMPEARRTVISNIHEGGIPAVEAGAYAADIIKKMMEKKASGVDLRL